MANQNQIREQITNQIVEHLESGKTAPWCRPWSLDRNAGHPTNVVSKKAYRGINPILLMISSMKHGFQSKHWATFKQWKDLGGSVKRRPKDVKPGEFGTTIIFYSPITKKETNASGEEKEDKYFILKKYTVFNIDQVDGSDLDHLRVGHGQIEAEEIQERYEAADRAIEATEADIRHGGSRAYYSSQQDYIQVPHRHQFEMPEYYETVFHELTHWTENSSRLDWDRTQQDKSYAMGELIAELSSCFVASELGLPTAERLENHASYLEHWLKQMKDDPKFIFKAATQASKSADYILEFSRQLEKEPDAMLV